MSADVDATLMACPWCRSPKMTMARGFGTHGRIFKAVCMECNGTGPTKADEDEARAAANLRPAASTDNRALYLDAQRLYLDMDHMTGVDAVEAIVAFVQARRC